jgi:endonuclease III
MPAESLEKKTSRAKKIITRLKKQYPGATTALQYDSPHQLLVATILSAQSTDERVNMVTPGLFKKYPSVQAFADARLPELEKDIYTTGFYRNKAKAIKKSAQEIVGNYGGKVPDNLDDLVKLTGVGRKTASVVLGAAFGLAEGIVVDTHVNRISQRLGLTKHKDPTKIEQDLMKLIPRKDWIIFANLLILHGRALCKARKPNCPDCPINKLCPSAQL